jgi:predicted RNase H-like HicB family nuclease
MNQAENCDTDELRPEYSDADFVGSVRGKYAGKIAQLGATVAIACQQQADGRWLAYLPAMSRVRAYGETREDAIGAVERLAAPAINSLREPDDELRMRLDVIVVDADQAQLPLNRSK